MPTVKYTEIYEAVVELTSRPDKAATIALAIKTATLQAHNSEEYYQDKVILEVSPTLDEDSGRYLLDVSSMPFVRHRKILQLVDLATGLELDLADSTEIFAADFAARTNMYYMAGMTANIVATSLGSVRCTYLQKPDVDVDTYSSWIAEENANLIAYGAAANVHAVVGKKEEGNGNLTLFASGIQDLKTSYIT